MVSACWLVWSGASADTSDEGIRSARHPRPAQSGGIGVRFPQGMHRFERDS